MKDSAKALTEVFSPPLISLSPWHWHSYLQRLTEISQSYTLNSTNWWEFFVYGLLPWPVKNIGFVVETTLKFVSWHSSAHTSIAAVFPGVSCSWRNTTVLPKASRDSVFNKGDPLFHEERWTFIFRSRGFPHTPPPGHRKRHVIYMQAEWLDWMASTYDHRLRKLEDMDRFLSAFVFLSRVLVEVPTGSWKAPSVQLPFLVSLKFIRLDKAMEFSYRFQFGLFCFSKHSDPFKTSFDAPTYCIYYYLLSCTSHT